ncbi:MAG: rod shape-determining protein RodA [Raineya sp.]|jgi:rod shape determining protein RodA|nr:rod shape-determining protein RodA [Raineya sp.]
MITSSIPKNSRSPLANLDVLTVFIYIFLVFMGLLSIYSASFNEETPKAFYDMSTVSGRQILFIGTAFVLIMLIFLLDYRFVEGIAYVFYGVTIILLIAVILFGREINGQKNWLHFGSFGLQPTEFTKISISLVLARYLGSPGSKLTDKKIWMVIGGIFILPAIIILKQGDYGSLMVFAALQLALYREGMPLWIILVEVLFATLFILSLIFKPVFLAFAIFLIMLSIVGFMLITRRKISQSYWITFVGATIIMVAFVIFTPKIFTKLKRYHQDRIMVLVDDNAVDKKQGAYYNLAQSKITIGSGGFSGKGYLEGTQTKYGFVPEQHTDFIFCTVGEEFGFLGSITVIGLFVTLLIRIIFIAERQKNRFARIYGYCVASILFAHFAFNISMTIGLFPTIGVPLPFMSYGGSSLWGFTVLLFLLLKLDSHRNQLFSRD